MFEKRVVGFKSKRQTSTTKASTEAEILAISMTLGDYEIFKRKVHNIFSDLIKIKGDLHTDSKHAVQVFRQGHMNQSTR
jgi:hypothetical protein